MSARNTSTRTYLPNRWTYKQTFYKHAKTVLNVVAWDSNAGVYGRKFIFLVVINGLNEEGKWIRRVNFWMLVLDSIE